MTSKRQGVIIYTFEEWKQLHPEFMDPESDAYIGEAVCKKCDGSGEDVCPHCDSVIECEYCQGTGIVPADLDKLKSIYKEQLAMDLKRWDDYLSGKAVRALEEVVL